MEFITIWIIFIFVLLFGFIYFIVRVINKFLLIKEEQNDLLREILKKMDHK